MPSLRVQVISGVSLVLRPKLGESITVVTDPEA